MANRPGTGLPGHRDAAQGAARVRATRAGTRHLLPGPAIPPLDQGPGRLAGGVVADGPRLRRPGRGHPRQEAAVPAAGTGAGHLGPGPAIPPLDQGPGRLAGGVVADGPRLRRPGGGDRAEQALPSAARAGGPGLLPGPAIPALDERPAGRRRAHGPHIVRRDRGDAVQPVERRPASGGLAQVPVRSLRRLPNRSLAGQRASGRRGIDPPARYGRASGQPVPDETSLVEACDRRRCRRGRGDAESGRAPGGQGPRAPAGPYRWRAWWRGRGRGRAGVPGDGHRGAQDAPGPLERLSWQGRHVLHGRLARSLSPRSFRLFYRADLGQ